jgi:hypothetical protein
MGEGKNRLSSIVDDQAKENLVVYQRNNGIKTRDDAIEKILPLLLTWQAQEKHIKKQTDRIAELEAELAKLREQQI